MKKFILFILPIIATSLLISCGGNEETETTEAPPVEEIIPEVCTYSFDTPTTELIWTAYKHTAKAGVKGEFDDIFVSSQSDSSVAAMLTNSTFTITTASINSADSVRDYKINEFFFKKMTETAEITGIISSANEVGGMITLSINGVFKEVEYSYTYEEPTLKLKATVDLEDFNGQEAISSLNEVCAEKHTGADGESILWPDVDILVTGNLIKDCQ